MIKKAFKYFFLGILGLIILSIIAYYSFIGVEYATGGKFVEYLKLNSEVVKTSDDFNFNNMQIDIKNNQLILVGEIHGIKESSNFDIKFFKHLHKNHGVRHYLAELDIVQADLMNEYLKTGNDSLLHDILKKWVVIQGRNNKDYYEKYKKFYEFYNGLPKIEKFTFIGVDRIQDWKLLTKYVNRLIYTYDALPLIDYNPKTIKSDLKEKLTVLIESDSLESKDSLMIQNLISNLDFVNNKIGREEVMLNNFQHFTDQYGLENKKIYGFFGTFHVYKYRVNGNHPFASLIRQSEMSFNDKILSVSFLYVDSYMVLDSKMLPEQARTGKVNSRIPLSTDNILFMYIYGVQDFKRVVPENHKSILKLNGQNNPYAETERLTTTYKLLPIIPSFEMTDKGKPYLEYTVFVRNSDWAEPYVK